MRCAFLSGEKKFDRFYLEAMADEFENILPFTADEIKEVISEEAEKADANEDGKIDAREVVERLKAMVIEVPPPFLCS